MLNTLRADPQTSEEEHFKLVLVQTEMERVKFLVRSYVRTRLAKVSENPPPLSLNLPCLLAHFYLQYVVGLTWERCAPGREILVLDHAQSRGPSVLIWRGARTCQAVSWVESPFLPPFSP